MVVRNFSFYVFKRFNTRERVYNKIRTSSGVLSAAISVTKFKAWKCLMIGIVELIYVCIL